MLRKINPIYSPESISFQNPAFYLALEGIIAAHRTGTGEQDLRSNLEMEIASAIKKYTNMNFEIIIGNYPMAVEMPKIDKNSPLIEGYGWTEAASSKQSISDIRKSKSAKLHAMIDPDSSYVSGYLAELPPTRLYMNEWQMYQKSKSEGDGRKYTAGEMAAVIVHEVGHIWAFFMFLVRFRTDNQVLGATVRDLDGTADMGKRELIIKEAATALDLETIDATELSHKNNLTVYTVIITSMARRNRTQSGSAGYDINSFEMLADQFANRHGAGRDLVTALDKMEKGNIAGRGMLSYIFFEFVKVAMALLGLVAGAFGPGLSFIIFTYLTLVIMADSHHEWYDKTGYRFKRISNDLIEQLKDPKLPKDVAARVRADIDAIAEVNARYKDHVQLVGLVYDYLIPSGVNKRKDIAFQQSLEAMSANKLFYYASQLKHA